MMTSPAEGESNSPENFQAIDEICDEFEALYQQGQTPALDEFLKRTNDLQRSTLLIELVKLECHYRRASGRTISLREYVARFPEYSESIYRLAREVAPEQAPWIPARYELKSPLGSGGFGTVWKAWDSTLERYVALKVPKNVPLSPSESRMFLNEARAAAKLAIPEVARILEFDGNFGHPYIAYEFVEGGTLKALLDDGRLEQTAAVQLCLKIVRAVERVHELKVIHRDLKPSNILINSQGDPQILDFGFAKRVDSESTATQSGGFMGSLAYMSPEQATGSASKIDHRTDIYSLGAILYEFLTGQLVFRGTPAQVLNQLLHQAPSFPARAIPKDLETICLKALSKTTSDRFQSVRELGDELERFLLLQPIQTRRDSWFTKCRRWCYKHPFRVAMLLMAVCGVALASMIKIAEDRKEFRRTHQLVKLKSNPDGARIMIYPLSARDGTPEYDRRIDGGITPMSQWLPPGDYLFVVYTDETTFHEVQRHVPTHEEASKMQRGFRHQIWKNGNGFIELPKIKLWNQADAVKGMASIETEDFVMGVQGDPMELAPHTCSVSDFHLDTHEVSLGEFQAASGTTNSLFGTCAGQPRHPDNAVTCFNYDQAVEFAESIGKRLPTEGEYEFVARHCSPAVDGTIRTYGSVLVPQVDAVKIDDKTTIFGLYSNVAEWTGSWHVPYPNSIAELPIAEDAKLYRSVRGGTMDHIHAKPGAVNPPNGTKMRVPVDRRSSNLPGLGFRGARSKRPRLSPSDFERHVLVPQSK